MPGLCRSFVIKYKIKPGWAVLSTHEGIGTSAINLFDRFSFKTIDIHRNLSVYATDDSGAIP